MSENNSKKTESFTIGIFSLVLFLALQTAILFFMQKVFMPGFGLETLNFWQCLSLCVACFVLFVLPINVVVNSLKK